jgi:hypothetical protein
MRYTANELEIKCVQSEQRERKRVAYVYCASRKMPADKCIHHDQMFVRCVLDALGTRERERGCSVRKLEFLLRARKILRQKCRSG